MIPSCPPQIDRQFWAWQAQAAVMEAVMEAVRALAGALAARGTNEATALKQEICFLRLGPRV